MNCFHDIQTYMKEKFGDQPPWHSLSMSIAFFFSIERKNKTWFRERDLNSFQEIFNVPKPQCGAIFGPTVII